MTESARDPLLVALEPFSVAIIGASDNPHKIGGRPLAYLSRFGYQGAVYPINPNRAETQGFKSYPDLAALPHAPEMAVIAVPGEAAVHAIEQCATLGVRVAVILASGFGEVNDAGREQQRHMVATARAAGMRIIGPNTQGLANFATGAVTSFSTMFIEVPPKDGPVGIVSQSGAMSVVPYGLLRARGIGVRHSHATGNDCDVTACELASRVAQDPDLKLLLIYLEGIRDPWHLAETARIARERDLPIIALKSGRTPAGQSAASSHTGALANEDKVVDAFFEQHGIWRARGVGDAVDAAELYLKGWRPKGRRLVIISNSGAVGVMAADAATQAGLKLAKLSDQTRGGLAEILPSFATTVNPVDITAALLSNSHLFGDILPVIARDRDADAFLIGIPVAGTGYDVDAFVRDAAQFGAATGKPLVIAAPQPMIADRFKAAGLAVFRTESEAVSALHQFLSHHELMLRAKDKPAFAHRYPSAAQTSQPRMLNEAESLALAARHGVPIVAHRLCRSPQAARDAFDALGGPVAVKGCSTALAHKSELGLVRLGMDSAQEAARAYRDMEQTLRSRDLAFDGVIVAAMARGRRELMIGAHVDPVFGPVIVFGDGGKYVEAMPDVQMLLPPFTEADVTAALSRLRIAPLLAGVRGEAPMATREFCAAVVAVAQMMLDPASDVVSLDLNPVMVGSAGEGCVAADGVVFLCGG
jgi:acetate---CoA ligase (ADP-forming)